jgi:ketosteroid isomerase-like protein
MSEETVEIVRSAFEAYGRRDIAAFLTLVDRAFELQSAIVGGAEGSTYRGHDAIRQWFEDSDAGFEELVIEASEWRDLGDGRVLVLGRIRARGRGSGLELDSPTGWVATVRNGKLTSAQGFLNWQMALELAEVRE